MYAVDLQECNFIGGMAMAELLGTFDVEGFFRSLDAVRQSKGLTWKQVSDQCGVGAWTLTRLSQGGRPDVDTLSALATWSALDPTDFIVSESRPKQETEPLAAISRSLWTDPNLDESSKRAIDEMIKSAYEKMRKSKQ